MDTESPQESFKDAIAERLSHPVTGIFAIAWLICNWKTLFVLAIDDSAATFRISKALEYSDIATLLLIPLLATIGYVLFSPVLKAVSARWNDFVSEKEELRIYHSTLDTLRKKADIAKRSMARVDARIVEQQAQLMDLEQQIGQKELERREVDHNIEAMLSLSNPKWNPHGSFVFNEVADKFVRVEKLKEEMLKKHPDLKDYIEQAKRQ